MAHRCRDAESPQHYEGEANMNNQQRRWVGLGGLALVVVLLVTIFTTPNTPDATAGPAQVAKFVHAHRGGLYLNAYLTSLAVLIAGSFLWYLREVVAPGSSGSTIGQSGIRGRDSFPGRRDLQRRSGLCHGRCRPPRRPDRAADPEHFLDGCDQLRWRGDGSASGCHQPRHLAEQSTPELARLCRPRTRSRIVCHSDARIPRRRRVVASHQRRDSRDIERFERAPANSLPPFEIDVCFHERKEKQCGKSSWR